MKWQNIFIPEKLCHAIRIEAKTITVFLKYGMPDVMPQFLGGLGDELLLTAVVHEFKRRKQALKIWQVSSAAELLACNPDYDHVFTMDEWPLRYSNLLNRCRLHLRYSQQPVAGEQETPPQEHIIASLCRAAGIRGEVALRPYYFYGPEEAEAGRLAPVQIAIQSIGEFTHETWMRNKLWYHDRFQQVVDRLRLDYPEILIIQLGVEKDHALKEVLDLRGRTTLRQTAAILGRSLCFIGTQGLLAHVARAVECRSVIIYGGREHAWQSGYTCNENLETFPECAPCWKWNECIYNRRCMAMITPEEVLDAVGRVLQKQGQPLETDTVFIE